MNGNEQGPVRGSGRIGRAQDDIRASVQALFTFTGGLGSLVGYLVGGWITDYLGDDIHKTFLFALVLMAAGLVLLLLGFRENPRRRET